MSIKLVAIDLDDTLLNSKLEISNRNKEVLEQVRLKGVNVTFATGRMYPVTLPIAQQMDIDIPLITYQGALVKKSQSNQILYSRNVAAELAIKVIEKVKDYGYHYQVYLGDNLYMEQLTPEGKAYSEQLKIIPVIDADLLKHLTEDPIKIMIIHNNPEQLINLELELQKLYGDILYITRSKTNYLEVMNSEATKLKALQYLADYLGVTKEETMAIGDSYTDLEIIKWSGVGVAMANSIDEIVKNEANYVCCSNDEDGVAEALERFILRT